MKIVSLILTLAIISGQLIKLQIGDLSSGTLLDMVLGTICLFGVYRLKFRLQSPPLFIKFGLGFIFAGVVSLIISPISLTANEFLISITYSLRFLIYILFGWLLYAKVFPDVLSQLESIFIYSAFGLALLGVLQLIFLPNLMFLSNSGWDPHYFRTVATFLDPNFLGAFLTANFLLVTLKLVNAKRVENIGEKKFHWLVFILLYIAIATTFSRGTALFLGVSLGLLSVLLLSLKLFLITLILLGGFVLSFYLYQQNVSIPRNIDREASAVNRLSTWQEGIKIFRASPIFGVGFNSYRFALEDLNLAPKQLINSRGGASNDSSLLFVLATTGGVGFAVFLGFLTTLILIGIRAFKTGNQFGAVYVASIIGLIANSFFNNTLFYPFILFWLITFAAKLESSN